MYYLYHIPGKKIGVTRDLNTRVTLIQGYKENEYEVLEQSDDIDYISDREIELQKSYGYKVDRQSYKNLINKNNKMKINATEQTSTFPVSIKQAERPTNGQFRLKLENSQVKFTVTKENIPWIMANARTLCLMITDAIYTTKLFRKHQRYYRKLSYTIKDCERFDLIRQWAQERGIYDKGNSHTQYVKLMEEAGELAQALLNKDSYEIKDAIGDMVVVLTNSSCVRRYAN